MNHLNNKLLQRLALLIIGGLFISMNGWAQFTITENFKGSSVGSNIILGGNPTAYLTSGNPDPTNDGWLRLTKDNGSQRGYAYIDNSFPSTSGVYIEFEYKTWRTTGSSADGICVFLFDADTPTFRIGAFGGSLGYAASTDNGGVAGLAGAYLGVGFDEYGNFASSLEGKDGSDGNNSTGFRANTITLRGPETPKDTSKKPYRYLAHKTVGGTLGDIAYGTKVNSSSDRPDDSKFYRRVRIYVEPEGGKYRLRVQWTTAVNGTFTELVNYLTEDLPPTNLKLGFSASTGGFVNYHEIRNLLITTPGDVLVQKSVDKVNAPQDGALTYTINVINNSTATLTGLKLNDVIKDGNGNSIAYGGKFSITSVTFKNNGNTNNIATGFVSGTPRPWNTNSLDATMTLAPNSTATFTVTGTLNGIPDGGRIVNSVDIIPPTTETLNDDLTNNHSEVSTTVYNPALDLKIEKTVDNHGAAKASGNTFTITVTNNSVNNKVEGGTVTVSDVIPAGLTVTDYTGKSGGSLTSNGWTPSFSGSTYTFTRSDVLNGLLTYLPIVINVTADTPTTALHEWTNTATVAYTGDTDLSNNKATATLKWYNYWYGTNSTDWGTSGNWTANFVPAEGEDIEFATADNNGASGYGNGLGTAIKDLDLDAVNQSSSGGRIIGDLINNSSVNLNITTGNQLKINGVVTDTNTAGGTIVVKADPENKKTNGTLIFTDPTNNTGVGATVEFYSKAYECSTCGYYRKAWQYFGIPITSSSTFPVGDVTGTETINQWVEPFNGNKWQTAPYDPTKFTAFKGYEMTNDATTLPTEVYKFIGTLNVGNATVSLTQTPNVNYSGANLVGNSFTAAIPINSDALKFSPTIKDQSVYLFNTGTRDQWRKLNGSTYNLAGIAAGQYLAVPINLAGQEGIPAMIPSTHAFMIRTDESTSATTTTLTIDYSKLVKNQTIKDASGNSIATRSTTTTTTTGAITNTSISQLPSILMDVIGQGTADRVWIFSKESTTYGFDSGWDGRKMAEDGLSQLYVSATDSTRLQVATVPSMDRVAIGFIPATDGQYTLEFAFSTDLNKDAVYLNDLVTGKTQQISSGDTYSFEAKAGQMLNRFSLSYKAGSRAFSSDEDLIGVAVAEDGKVKITNGSKKSLSAQVSDEKGVLLQRIEVKAGGEVELKDVASGTYIIRLQNSTLNDVRKITVKNILED